MRTRLLKVSMAGFVLIFSLLAYAPPSTLAGERCRDTASFKLYILEQGWADLRLGYALEPSWAILQALDLDTAEAYVITEKDVAVFDWAEQIITLNPVASAWMIEALELTPETAPQWFSHDLYQQGFVVTLDDQPLYGGVFLPAISAMGIAFPVMYIAATTDEVQLMIRPTHSAFQDFSTISPELRARIELDAIKDFFVEQDKLVE